MFSHLHPGAIWRRMAAKSPHYIFVSREDQHGIRIADVSAHNTLTYGGGVPGALLTPTAEEMLQKYPGAHLSWASWGRNVYLVDWLERAPVGVQGSLYCELRYVLPDQTLFKVEYGERSETSYGSSHINAPNIRLSGPGVDAVLEQLAVFVTVVSGVFQAGIDWSAS